MQLGFCGAGNGKKHLNLQHLFLLNVHRVWYVQVGLKPVCFSVQIATFLDLPRFEVWPESMTKRWTWKQHDALKNVLFSGKRTVEPRGLFPSGNKIKQRHCRLRLIHLNMFLFRDTCLLANRNFSCFKVFQLEFLTLCLCAGHSCKATILETSPSFYCVCMESYDIVEVQPLTHSWMLFLFTRRGHTIVCTIFEPEQKYRLLHLVGPSGHINPWLRRKHWGDSRWSVLITMAGSIFFGPHLSV